MLMKSNYSRKTNFMKSFITHILSWFLSIILCFSFGSVWSQLPDGSVSTESMKVTLYHLNADGTTPIIDGNLTLYDNSFSNSLEDDAIKMTNFGENFGIARLSTNLSIEQRLKIDAIDTTFFSMWNVSVRNYRVTISNTNMNHPGLLAFFEDSYLNTSTPLLLNGINTIDFSVNSNAASYQINRFRIVFRNPALIALPTKFISFNAIKKPTSILLNWNVDNESSMNTYQVERSTDGVHFNVINTVDARNIPGIIKYESTDATYSDGENYYRIRGIELSGASYLSAIVKISAVQKNSSYLVYPNPVTNRKIHVQFMSDKSGTYRIQLISTDGKIIPLSNVESTKGRNIMSIPIQARLMPGIYKLRIIDPVGNVNTQNIHIL